MTKPKITIGIPAYGRPEFLREAIQSCLAQTYANLEILVADDRSPVDPWPQITDLKTDRWTYVRHEKNLGGPGNFNYLIQKATGDYFVLHQDDDLLHPDFCERAVAALEADPDAVLYSGWLIRGPQPWGCMGHDLHMFSGPWQPLDYLRAGPHRIEKEDAQLTLIFAIPYMHPAIAMRISTLNTVGGYFSEFMHGSDNITFIRMLKHGHLIYDTRISGFFRLHSGNVSRSSSDTYQNRVRRRVLGELLPLIQEAPGLWLPRLIKLLGHLRRRDRWLILQQALEAGYPSFLVQTVSKSIGKKGGLTTLRARLMKANWKQQWISLWEAD